MLFTHNSPVPGEKPIDRHEDVNYIIDMIRQALVKNNAVVTIQYEDGSTTVVNR